MRILRKMHEWLKWKVCRKEMMALHRYRLAILEVENLRPEVRAAACAAEWIRHEGEGIFSFGVTALRKALTECLPAYQQAVEAWRHECFGTPIDQYDVERVHRFLEEAIELGQSLRCTHDEAISIVNYVYGRPVGDPKQELGGTMVTLAIVATANGLDLHREGLTELNRCWSMIPRIRAKNASKPKFSPLPGSPEGT